MLTVKWAMLCDYASRGSDEKVNLLGVYDDLLCEQLPFVLSKMCVVVNGVISGTVNGLLSIRIIQNKQAIFVSAPALIRYNDSRAMPTCFISNLDNLNFPNFGRYAVQIFFDDRPIHSVPLSITHKS